MHRYSMLALEVKKSMDYFLLWIIKRTFVCKMLLL